MYIVDQVYPMGKGGSGMTTVIERTAHSHPYLRIERAEGIVVAHLV